MVTKDDNPREFCGKHDERGEKIDCAREELATVSADVRVLTTELRALGEKIDRHLEANDAFMPQIHALMARFAVLETRMQAVEESNKTIRNAVISIIVALVIAGIIAAIKSGGGA